MQLMKDINMPFLRVQRALLQVLVRTDRWTRRQPHGSTLTSANSRESILNDTYGIHRVDFPLMPIGGGADERQ